VSGAEFVVKHHRGRSGKSVFAWRVYRVVDWNGNGSRIVRTQLAKFRTEEAANKAAARMRLHDATAQARSAEILQRAAIARATMP
jgi:hypothetical protein